MGFGTELQSAESHDQIISVQHFEIKFLQCIKQFISHRIKIEKQYAQNLLESVAAASKFETTYSSSISPLYKVRLVS